MSVTFYQLDASFENIFASCNEPAISASEFKKQCNKIKPGEDIRMHLTSIGASEQNSSCIKGKCTLSAQGGEGMFCDICAIEYNEKTYNVISVDWLFGDN